MRFGSPTTGRGSGHCGPTGAPTYASMQSLIIAYVSQGETLHPGEILASGTVGGGCELKSLQFLGDGDEVELEVPPIGRLLNRVVRPKRDIEP